MQAAGGARAGAPCRVDLNLAPDGVYGLNTLTWGCAVPVVELLTWGYAVPAYAAYG